MKDIMCQYIAIRKNEDGEYFDLPSRAWLYEECEKNVQETNKKIPMWAKDNPVIRIAKCKVTIEEER